MNKDISFTTEQALQLAEIFAPSQTYEGTNHQRDMAHIRGVCNTVGGYLKAEYKLNQQSVIQAAERIVGFVNVLESASNTGTPTPAKLARAARNLDECFRTVSDTMNSSPTFKTATLCPATTRELLTTIKNMQECNVAEPTHG